MNLLQPLTTWALLAFSFLLHAHHPSAPPAGTIAYTRGSTEIRLVEANGSNDRQLWTHADATAELGLNELAWRPDGNELVFSSSHAAAYSLYHADLYAIKPDGSGFRKLTNPPDRTEFAKYPKGTVSVTVRNTQFTFQQTQASAGSFIVYMTGADAPQQIICPPGASKTVVFKSVADFGKKAQAIVAMWGKYRWFIPGTDVQAGQTIKAPDLTISGDGIELLGAFRPVWRGDDSTISYRSGTCVINRVPASMPAGEYIFNPMFAGKNPFGACSWDWGPAPNFTDQLIYTENSGEESSIFLLKEGGTHPGTKLTSYSNIQYQLLYDLHWLPDGSGFLYSTVTLMRDAGNIFRYDFKTKQTTQVTHLENEFAHNFSIAPGGDWVVYERSRSHEDETPVDLWLTRIDGSEQKLLIQNGRNPSWRKP